MSPGQRLWMAVIYRALLDVTSFGEDAERRAARKWFERGVRDFVRACTNAVIDPEVLQARWEQAAAVLRRNVNRQK